MIARLGLQRWMALVAMTAAISALSVPKVSGATTAPPKCQLLASQGGGKQYHCYVFTEQDWAEPTIDGMGGTFSEPDVMPSVNKGDYSIGQLTLASITKNFGKDIEFGWIVDPKAFGDKRPHLFVALRLVSFLPFHFGGKGLCFVGNYPDSKRYPPCPSSIYTQISSTNHPGMAVGGPPGNAIYHVGYYAPDNSWWIQYGNSWMGRVDATYWHVAGYGGFARGNAASWYGEVAYSQHYCTPMGFDLYGSLPNAPGYVKGMFYETPTGAFTASATLTQEDAPKYWDSNRKYFSDPKKRKAFSSFRYGGPFGGPNSC